MRFGTGLVPNSGTLGRWRLPRHRRRDQRAGVSKIRHEAGAEFAARIADQRFAVRVGLIEARKYLRFLCVTPLRATGGMPRSNPPQRAADSAAEDQG